MKEMGKVIPLFGRKVAPVPELEKVVEPLEISEAELEEIEQIVLDAVKELSNPQELVGKTELKKPTDWDDANPREAGIADWIEENCNELPVHETENGLLLVGVPLHTFDELLRLVVDSVNDYEGMRSALERIAGRENELDAKIARDALNAIAK